VARLALTLELPLHHGLRGDARVIDARLPERREACHAVVAREHVFERAEERVAHVQRARDVGRRHRQHVARARIVCGVARGEDAELEPLVGPAGFDFLRFVGFG
jgi:hypothetical protein